MARSISSIATEVARRWIAARDRLTKRGCVLSQPIFEDMREFAAGICDDADTLHLDVIVDLALNKIANHDLTIGSGSK